MESAHWKFHIFSQSLQSHEVVLVEVRVEVGLALLSVKGIRLFFMHFPGAHFDPIIRIIIIISNFFDVCSGL